MSDVNSVTLIGNLGENPVLRQTGSGVSVCNYSLATTKNWINPQGKKCSRTEWHKIVVWGRQAELCAEYLNKGRQVFVTGELQSKGWTDNKGNQHINVEVHANFVKFLGGKRDDEIVEIIESEEFDALKEEEEEEQQTVNA